MRAFMQPIFVSFHTGGRYARHAAELAETLATHGLQHDIEQLPDAGEWVHNCAMKPSFIARKMEQHHGTPIVWVDADARVRKFPQLLVSMPAIVDVGCHYLNGIELLSGTLYFGATECAADLVSEWNKLAKQTPHIWDQKLLDKAISRVPIRMCCLPESYVRIFDSKNETTEIVIEHLQASRGN